MIEHIEVYSTPINKKSRVVLRNSDFGNSLLGVSVLNNKDKNPIIYDKINGKNIIQMINGCNILAELHKKVGKIFAKDSSRSKPWFLMDIALGSAFRDDSSFFKTSFIIPKNELNNMIDDFEITIQEIENIVLKSLSKKGSPLYSIEDLDKYLNEKGLTSKTIANIHKEELSKRQ